MSFRNNAECNEGHSDWFAPACGELAYMCVKHTEINDLLHRIGGAALSGVYYSVSEISNTHVWCIQFNQHNSMVLGIPTHMSFYVRLLRFM